MNVFDLFARLGLDSSEYEKGLNEAEKKGANFGSGLKSAAKVGAKAVAAATTAVVGFGTTSVKTGMDFDSSMSQVAATMGKSVDEIEELRTFAQDMGRTTAFSATQAADALNYMALAGYEVNESMTMLPNVLNLAAAGNMDLARASDMVTDAQSALGLEMKDMEGFVDEMAKTASKSNTSVEQLGDAILTIGGTAKILSGGTNELNTSLGILADNGIKGAEGGTKLRNILLSLSAPTDKAAAKLESLGVTAIDATTGDLRPLEDIMQDLNKSLTGLGEAEKAEVINTIFNKQDIAGVNALLNTSVERWDELSAAIGDSKGAAEEMAKTQLDNLAGDITLFKSALEGAQIAISDTLTPSLRDFVQFGTDGLSKLTAAFQEGGLDSAMEVFGTILSDGLNMIIERLPKFVNAGIQLLGALGQGLMDNLPTIIEAGNTILLQLVEALIEALPHLVEGAIQIISQLAIFLGEHLPELIPAIVDMILAITDALIDNVDLLIDGAVALMVGLAQGLVNAIPKLIEKAPMIIDKLVNALINALPKIVDAGMKIILALIDGIIKTISRLPQAVQQVKNTLANGFLNLINSASTWGRDLIANFINGLREKWNDLKSAVSDMAGTVSSYLHFSEPDVGPLSNFSTYAPDMMKLFAEGIRDNTDLITNQIEKSFDFGNDITSVSSNMTASASSISYSDTLSQILFTLRDILDKEPVEISAESSGIFKVVRNEAKQWRMSTGLVPFPTT